MADEHVRAQALAAYQGLCDMLDSISWKYDKAPEELSIYCGATGDDLPIDVKMMVDEKRMLINFFSKLSFVVPEGKRAEAAVVINIINAGLVDGCFDYNVLTGEMLFRMNASYRESVIGQDLFQYLLAVAIQTVDDYNDQLLMYIKGKMTLQEFYDNAYGGED